jgi:hypothetical protein
MEFDTLSDLLPQNAPVSAQVLNELLFAQLRSFVGVVFSGQSSPAFGDGAHDWGGAIRLSEDETLQLRVAPKGVMSGSLAEANDAILILAARRRRSHGQDVVTLSILWHPMCPIDIKYSSFESCGEAVQSTSARNLHLVCPSLFNHHDAEFVASEGAADREQQWPVLDLDFFHCLRSSTYSIHRLVKLPGTSGKILKTVTAAPGLSQFLICDHLAGLNSITDEARPSSLHLKSAEWANMVKNLTTSLHESIGFSGGVTASHNAIAICDLLTCEGLLAILGFGFNDACFADMMHTPGGFPLLLAFATRLACYPSRFRLAEGTAADQQANRELLSIFEASWSPVHPTKAGSRNVYAIDLAIRQAYSEARAASRKHHDSDAPVVDNLTFWHRAGQRCVTALFGPQAEDFQPPHTTFGTSTRVSDPLQEARNAVIQKQMTTADAVRGANGRVSTFLASTQEKRSVLLAMLNSVEHWLRTGTYCGMQLHQRRKPRVESKCPLNLDRAKLQLALERGMQESIRDAVASGEAESEEAARRLAGEMREGLERALDLGDGASDFATVRGLLPGSADDASVAELAKVLKEKASAESNGSRQILITSEDVCEDAFSHAVGCVSAAMCQGPLVQRDFGVNCHVCGPYAINTCADCDSEVHVLAATFLATRHSACARCKRPRCIPCTALAHSRSGNAMAVARSCKRCKIKGTAKATRDATGKSGRASEGV